MMTIRHFLLPYLKSIKFWLLLLLITLLFTLEKAKKDPFLSATHIKNKNSTFQVVIWTETEKPYYKAGENIVLFVKATANCYLLLFNINSEGNGLLIFPNQHQQENYLTQNTLYRIPPLGYQYCLKATGSGKELIKAIATKREIKWSFGPWKRKEFFNTLKTLERKLKAQTFGDWTEAEVWVQIKK